MIAATDIHVCLPAYNEASVLPGVVADLRAAGYPHVCIIDDGSDDETAELLPTLGVAFATHLINRGAGAAVQTAIELARREAWSYVLFMDADGQHVPTDIRLMADRMSASGADLVVGSRFLETDDHIPRSRRGYNFIANRMTNLFCKGRYSDSQSGLRLLGPRAIARLNLEVDGFGFCSEMLLKAERAELTIAETATQVRYTDYSKSKGQDFQMAFRTAFGFLWNIWVR
jgi:glycosyltransferase involved in cell wall biosynthesis